MYNNRGAVYKYVRNETTKVSRYVAWEEFDCNLQPVNQKDWFSWMDAYKTNKMYTLFWWIEVWDKVVIQNIVYIVNYKQKRESPEITYFKYILIESEWS